MRTAPIADYHRTAADARDTMIAASEGLIAWYTARIADLRTLVISQAHVMGSILADYTGTDAIEDSDALKEIAALNADLIELRNRVIDRSMRSVSLFRARIDTQRRAIADLREATDPYLGMPDVPDVSPEQQLQIMRIAAQFAPQSAGDEHATEADLANREIARVNIAAAQAQRAPKTTGEAA